MTNKPITTDELVELLSKAPTHVGEAPIRRFAKVCVLGLFVTLIFYALLLYLGPLELREHYAQTIVDSPIVIFKQLSAFAAALIALLVIPRAMYLDASFAKHINLSITAFIGVMVLIFAWGLAHTPATQWSSIIFNLNGLGCLAYIALFSLPLLAAIVYALRYGAVVEMRSAGIGAAIIAVGIATVLYAFACPQDHPLFFSFWYSIANIVIWALGYLIAPRVFRW